MCGVGRGVGTQRRYGQQPLAAAAGASYGGVAWVALRELPSGGYSCRRRCHRARGTKSGQRCLDELNELRRHDGVCGSIRVAQAVAGVVNLLPHQLQAVYSVKPRLQAGGRCCHVLQIGADSLVLALGGRRLVGSQQQLHLHGPNHLDDGGPRVGQPDLQRRRRRWGAEGGQRGEQVGADGITRPAGLPWLVLPCQPGTGDSGGWQPAPPGASSSQLSSAHLAHQPLVLIQPLVERHDAPRDAARHVAGGIEGGVGKVIHACCQHHHLEQVKRGGGKELV